MTEYKQRTYEVRYPDGDTTEITAHQVYLADGCITLKKAPGDNPGNMVFAASPESGVTVRQISEG